MASGMLVPPYLSQKEVRRVDYEDDIIRRTRHKYCTSCSREHFTTGNIINYDTTDTTGEQIAWEGRRIVCVQNYVYAEPTAKYALGVYHSEAVLRFPHPAELDQHVRIIPATKGVPTLGLAPVVCEYLQEADRHFPRLNKHFWITEHEPTYTIAVWTMEVVETTLTLLPKLHLGTDEGAMSVEYQATLAEAARDLSRQREFRTLPPPTVLPSTRSSAQRQQPALSEVETDRARMEAYGAHQRRRVYMRNFFEQIRDI